MVWNRQKEEEKEMNGREEIGREDNGEEGREKEERKGKRREGSTWISVQGPSSSSLRHWSCRRRRWAPTLEESIRDFTCSQFIRYNTYGQVRMGKSEYLLSTANSLKQSQWR